MTLSVTDEGSSNAESYWLLILKICSLNWTEQLSVQQL